jgi:hypothetical protein
VGPPRRALSPIKAPKGNRRSRGIATAGGKPQRAAVTWPTAHGVYTRVSGMCERQRPAGPTRGLPLVAYHIFFLRSNGGPLAPLGGGRPLYGGPPTLLDMPQVPRVLSGVPWGPGATQTCPKRGPMF